MNLKSFKNARVFLVKECWKKNTLVSVHILGRENSIELDVLDIVIAAVVMSFLSLQDDGFSSLESRPKIGFD
ncbi:MAG: hypothetical protein QXY90_06025 [Candidatus Anstonellales archaeon]